MDKDKTKIIDEEETKVADDYVTASSASTVQSEGYDTVKSISQENDTTGDKTLSIFNKDDIRKKLDDELVEVPEIEADDMQTEYLSRLISRPFAHRTEEERLKINRNFLRDAAPLTLERLKDDVISAPEELLTGFSSLDRWISIPNRKFTFIAGRSQHGKTMFMLNLLLNMCRKYPDKHFIYYTYGEPIQDIELKLINMSGDKPFSPIESEGTSNNFKRWKYELQNTDIDTLNRMAETKSEYNGLKRFLEVSSRIHIIDGNYQIVDLIDSIKAFNSTLTIGGVFIDYLQAIRPDKINLTLSRRQQLQDISDRLIEQCNDSLHPFLMGVQLIKSETTTSEYDGLNLKYIKDIQDPEQYASLIIGVQNYAKSEYIGSNFNEQFKSRFFQYTLKKAEKMPETFRDKHPNTVILAKVMVNRAGPAPEVELLFNKWLMKITDFETGNKHLNQYDFLR